MPRDTNTGEFARAGDAPAAARRVPPRDRAGHLAVLVIAVTGLIPIAVLEIAVALPMTLRAYLSYFLVWSFVLVPFVYYQFDRKKLAIYGAFFAALAVLWLVPWNARKVFVADFGRVRPGMTAQTVERRMLAYPRDPPAPVPAGFSGEVTFRPRDAARFPDDWGVVSFDRGRVTRAVFFRDGISTARQPKRPRRRPPGG
jgi:hypothetical protein